MKNVKISEISNLNAVYESDELVEYGRKLHSEAVFMGLVGLIRLIRPGISKTAQIENKQGHLKYSH